MTLLSFSEFLTHLSARNQLFMFDAVHDIKLLKERNILLSLGFFSFGSKHINLFGTDIRTKNIVDIITHETIHTIIEDILNEQDLSQLDFDKHTVEPIVNMLSNINYKVIRRIEQFLEQFLVSGKR